MYAVNFLLSHTLFVSLENMVAAFPMRLSSSTSRERVSEIVEPRYMEIVIEGGESTPWHMTCVFFRLLVQSLGRRFRGDMIAMFSYLKGCHVEEGTGFPGLQRLEHGAVASNYSQRDST